MVAKHIYIQCTVFIIYSVVKYTKFSIKPKIYIRHQGERTSHFENIHLKQY